MVSFGMYLCSYIKYEYKFLLQSEANEKDLIVSDPEAATSSWGLTPYGRQQVLEVSYCKAILIRKDTGS